MINKQIFFLLFLKLSPLVEAQKISNDTIYFKNQIAGYIETTSTDTLIEVFNKQTNNFANQKGILKKYISHIDVVLNSQETSRLKLFLESYFSTLKQPNNIIAVEWEINLRYKLASNVQIAGTYLESAANLKNLRTTILILSTLTSSSLIYFVKLPIPSLIILVSGSITSIVLEYKSNQMLKKAGQYLIEK